MKNIHLIPTDKPSRLHLAYNKDYYLSVEPFIQLDTKNYKSFHIYITSDEEIKERDWHISSDGWCIDKTSKEDLEVVNEKRNGYKKIILTTDPDLIKDGLQAIDDEFLKWFVKNPSCEEVVINKTINPSISVKEPYYSYKIIIPKEEPKETLEDVAERLVPEAGCELNNSEASYWQQGWISGHIDAAKWQQERMYSEKEVKQFAFECVANFLSNDDNKVEIKLVDVIIDRLNNKFEQFKKK